MKIISQTHRSNDTGVRKPYKTHDWRVWFDSLTMMWKAQEWSGKSATISSPKFESNDLEFISEGKFLRFHDCEAKGGLIAVESSQDVTVDCLRLMPRTQVIDVPKIGAEASSKLYG